MIKHIVTWKINEDENKEAVALQIKEKLESLQDKTEGIIKIEVGIDYSKTEMSADLVLYSEFESKEALENYQIHPLHQEAGKFIKSKTHSRVLTDYEV